MSQYNTSKRKGQHSQAGYIDQARDWLKEKVKETIAPIRKEKQNQQTKKDNIKKETGYEGK